MMLGLSCLLPALELARLLLPVLDTLLTLVRLEL
jgi:hypothetical protein